MKNDNSAYDPFTAALTPELNEILKEADSACRVGPSHENYWQWMAMALAEKVLEITKNDNKGN